MQNSRKYRLPWLACRLGDDRLHRGIFEQPSKNGIASIAISVSRPMFGLKITKSLCVLRKGENGACGFNLRRRKCDFSHRVGECVSH